jgi:hypothetical protein
MLTRLFAATALVFAACGDDDSSDGIDAPTDAPDADAPDGPCGAGYQLTGEYIDWASTNAAFAGVPFAELELIGADPPVTATTAPNGRIQLCLPRSGVSLVRVTQDEAAPNGPYLDAMIVADPAVLGTPNALFSARGVKTSEVAQRWDELMSGMTFDIDAGNVLVVNRGTPVQVGVAGQDSYISDGADDATWQPGDTGAFTIFPNVALNGGTATLTGTFTGPRSVPVFESSLTIVVITN